MFKYTIVVEVSPDMSFKSMEELVEAIKLWRGVRNVQLQNASQQSVQADGLTVAALDNLSKKVRGIAGKIESRNRRR